ncbi:DUF2933 domain-containing protein [Bacillus coreaensis]
MEWLLLLICPLMMLFMMKGHFWGHKNSHGGHSHQHHDAQISNNVLTKVKDLELENEKLRKEISELSSLIRKEV